MDRLETIEYIKSRVLENPFCQVMKMDVEEVSRGHLVVSMPIEEPVHTNIFGYVHGGAYSGLADTAAGVCCFTEGEQVITVDASYSFIRNVHAGAKVYATAEVLQHGHKLMRTHCAIRDERGHLLMDGVLCFMIVGHVEGMPADW